MDVSKVTQFAKPTGSMFDAGHLTVSMDITFKVPDHLGPSAEAFADEVATAVEDGRVDGAEAGRLLQRGIALGMAAALDPGKS